MVTIVSNATAATAGNKPIELELGQVAFDQALDRLFLGNGTNVTTHLDGTVGAPATANKGWKEYLLAGRPALAEFTANKTVAGAEISFALPFTHYYLGTGAATLTIPTNATVPVVPGTRIRVLRGATAGALNIAFAGTPALLAPFDITTNGLYRGEAIELINLAADTWHVRALNDAQIRLQPYQFGASATWTAALGTTPVGIIQLTPAIQSGTLAVGTDTEESGGYFAVEAGAAGVAATATSTAIHGGYENSVFLRRPLDGTASAGMVLSVNDNGIDRIVFGLLHCPTGTADGTAIDATNYWISVVYEDATGTLINTTINGDLQFEMLRAVAGQDYPYPV